MTDLPKRARGRPCPNKLDSGAHCGDDGLLCEECDAQEEREWRWLAHVSKWAAGAPLDGEYERELRDAGRV